MTTPTEPGFYCGFWPAIWTGKDMTDFWQLFALYQKEIVFSLAVASIIMATAWFVKYY